MGILDIVEVRVGVPYWQKKIQMVVFGVSTSSHKFPLLTVLRYDNISSYTSSVAGALWAMQRATSLALMSNTELIVMYDQYLTTSGSPLTSGSNGFSGILYVLRTCPAWSLIRLARPDICVLGFCLCITAHSPQSVSVSSVITIRS
jgi:hypothetical protein